MFERFTSQARNVVVDAQRQARQLGHSEILPQHVLLGVLADDTSQGAGVLRELGVDHASVVGDLAHLGAGDGDALRAIGVDLAAVRERIEATFGPGALDRPRPRRAGLRGLLSGRAGGHLRFTAPARRALEQSLRQAVALHHHRIGTDHILLGLIADDRDPAALSLARLGADPGVVRSRVHDHLRRAA